jgi:hypothetical protein
MESPSPLNSWFRQQGSSNRMPSVQNKIKLGSNSTSRISALRQHQHGDGSSKTFPSLFRSQTKDVFNSNSLDNFNSKAHVEPPRTPKTPFPAHTFYSRCINDVTLINQPSKFNLVEPRELKYAKSKPYLSYLTFGCGKSKHYVWRIEKQIILPAKIVAYK